MTLGIIYLIGFAILVTLLFIVKPKWLVQDYPKEWEESEEKEFYRKSQK